MKPDLIMPLMETLPVEQQLSSYLPEVKYDGCFFGPCMMVLVIFITCNQSFIGSVDSRGYIGIAPKCTFPPTSGFFYLCEGLTSFDIIYY